MTRDEPVQSAHAPSGRTVAEKVLARAAGVSYAAVGTIVTARPDLALSHDNSAAIQAIWRTLGQDSPAIRDRIAITLDHAAPAPTPTHAANHATIRAFVREYDIAHFFEVGRGICHQVLGEEGLVHPGDLVLGADSHTPHFGWLGALGIGIGRTEMAALWATGALWLRVPETVRVDLTGAPAPWVTAKDIALTLIGAHGADGANYCAIEFDGDGVAGLSLDERATLANMMAEFGAKTAWMAPDEAVFRYLGTTAARERDRGGSLRPDADAAYASRLRIDLATLAPVVSRPHRVDDVAPVDALAETPVDAAFIGTCTNGRLEDIAAAHRILAGRRVARGTRLLIVPASSRVLEEASRRGWVADLVAAGATIGPPGCGPCMGNHLGVLAPGEVCISSANRNFRGRMGTRDAEIYLASPAVVAASAVTGRITHPAETEGRSA